jgi:hypothetical protein
MSATGQFIYPLASDCVRTKPRKKFALLGLAVKIEDAW